MNEMLNESHAFVEPTTYRENSVDKGKLIFKLSELPSIYTAHLKDFGILKQINKTWLKNSLLSHFSDAQEQTNGKNVLFVFKEATHGLRV